MTPLAIIIFTVLSGPDEGRMYFVVEKCSPAVIEDRLLALDYVDQPAMAQCFYGRGPMTSPRPMARADAA